MKKRLLFVLAAAALSSPAPAETLAERAARLHRDAIVVDTHEDLPSRLEKEWVDLAPGAAGLGTDFDGIEDLPTGLEDVSKLPRITEELLRRGHSEAVVRGVLGENFLRFWDRAEAARATVPPPGPPTSRRRGRRLYDPPAMIDLLQQAPAPGGAAGGLFQFLPMIFIFVIFYFLLIAPMRKRQKKSQEMLTKLKKGDEIVTSGGLFGRISAIDEERGFVVLEIAPNVKIKTLKSAVASLAGDPGASSSGTGT